MVGLPIRRFDRDGLIQAQSEILWEVEMHFVYTRQAGIRKMLIDRWGKIPSWRRSSAMWNSGSGG